MGDDPNSRIYTAKEALYEVLDAASGVSFGFATFPNYDGLETKATKIDDLCSCSDRDNTFVYSNGKTDQDMCNDTIALQSNTGSCVQGLKDNRPAGVCDQSDPAWDPNACPLCEGWEPNDDDAEDTICGNGNSLLVTTSINPRGLETGDVIPIDWGDDNVQRIQEILAPNLLLGESTPDFEFRRYINDQNCSAYTSNLIVRAIYGRGSTPIAAAMADFRYWYETDAGTGTAWKDMVQASGASAEFKAKKTSLLVVTDGCETCDGDAVPVAAGLFNDLEVKTYVVAYDVFTGAGDPCFVSLDDVAAAGGTTEAYKPTDKQELVDDLNAVLVEVQRGQSSFTAAATPPAEVNVRDKLYFSTFYPLDTSPHWPGQIHAFKRPLPLTGGRPDITDTDCSGANNGCLLWEAGAQLLTQAPSQTDVDGGNFKIGPGSAQRRVYYSQDAGADVVPRTRMSFVPPADPADQADLYGLGGMNITSCGSPPCVTEGVDIIKETLVKKQEDVIDVSNNTITLDYVLGDIFHSDPEVSGAPNRTRYYALNLEGVGLFEDCTDPNSKGYRCFFEKHRNRRRMLIMGSNDGQLHFFDAGLPTLNAGEVEFDNGSGKEVAAFIPRGTMEAIRLRAEGVEHQYGVDAPVWIDDVFIDPVHDVGAGDPPTDSHREWRTVLLGGLREGGQHMFALDITQPDTYDSDGIPEPDNTFVASCRDGVSGECLEFPRVLWELEDTWDEDNNGGRDMGHTWSKVNTGRIQVIESGTVVDKYVAIFAGGLDPNYLHPSSLPPPAFAPPPPQAATLNFSAIEDTYVRRNDEFSHGAEGDVNVKHISTSKSSYRQGFLKFDISSVSDAVTSATLTLNVRNTLAVGSDMRVEELNCDGCWWEDMFWSNRPGNANIGATIDLIWAPGNSGYTTHNIDVTSWVQSQSSDQGGDGIVSFTFRMNVDEGSAGTKFASRENGNSGIRPVLTIETAPAGPFCGDSNCDAGEDQCSCPGDCGSPPVSEGFCSDTLDNDCDTLIDCADPDCAADPACVVAPFCGDGNCDPGENTCNCAVDCGFPPGSETGLCSDSVDNDCDAATDCDDSDCSADAACTGPPPPPPPPPGAYSGNYLYIVDLETGNPIYKRLLDTVGGVTTPAMGPTEPAAVDTDQDGYIDTVYFGNTAGYLFKVDLSQAKDLVATTVTEYSTGSGVSRNVTRVIDSAWDPFAVFTTGGRPIYFPPSVVFVAELGKFALGFGTGDREDILAETLQEGRFYMILDDNFTAATAGLPFAEADYEEISADTASSPNVPNTTNFLSAPNAGKRPGWFMRLDAEERLIGPSTALTGTIAFSTFDPDDPGAGACGTTGATRFYVVNSTNANALMEDAGDDIRFRQVDKFVSNPFAETSMPGETGASNPCAGQATLTNTLETLLPASCKFGNATLNILTVRSDTGLECIAPVPICIQERNWKEF